MKQRIININYDHINKRVVINFRKKLKSTGMGSITIIRHLLRWTSAK